MKIHIFDNVLAIETSDGNLKYFTMDGEEYHGSTLFSGLGPVNAIKPIGEYRRWRVLQNTPLYEYCYPS